MKKIYSILLLIISIPLFSNADGVEKNGSIMGHVKTSDGKAAAFVTVGIKGTNKGTVTDDNGQYLMSNVKAGTYILKISYVGLESQEVQVIVKDGGQTVQDFVLTENSSKLNEVVIAGNRSANLKRPALGKTGIAAKDLPQAIQVFDSTIITDQQANRLADVIKNVNGVALGENRGSVNESFFARGYSLGSNNVLKNGARTSIGGSPEASTLESVEVLKGSAALLYGGVTGGAVVNMVTKKPKFYYGGELSMRAGSYSQYKPTLDVYGPIAKNTAFRLITTKENANSYRDYVKSDRFYINPSVLFNLGSQTELIVQGDYLKSNYTPDFGIGTVNNKIVDIGRDAFLNAVWAYNNTNTSSAQANLSHRFSDNWKLNFVSAFQSYTRNYFSAERPAAAATGIAARNLTRSKTQEYTFNQQATLTGSAITGSVKHTLSFGFDADQSRVRSYGFQINNSSATYNYGNVNLLDPSTYVTRTDIPDSRIVSNTLTPVYRLGSFAQDLVGLTEQFKVLIGLRYTWQTQPKARTYSDITGQTTAVANGLAGSKIDKAFSPKIGLIYQPLKTTSVYVSYANNFTSNSGVDVNGAAMGPSIIDQYEAGVKNDFWNGKVSINVTVYRIANDRFAQNAVLPDGTVTTAYKEFTGATKSDGLEVDITGRLSKSMYFIAGYSYNYFRYTKTLPGGITEGERIIGTTPHTANGTIFYTVNNGKASGLKLGVSGYYTGKRNMGFNTVKPPSTSRGFPINVTDFATFDVSAGYTYRKISILSKLSNITDEINYMVHENYSVNPIPPRMFSATLSYKF